MEEQKHTFATLVALHSPGKVDVSTTENKDSTTDRLQHQNY